LPGKNNVIIFRLLLIVFATSAFIALMKWVISPSQTSGILHLPSIYIFVSILFICIIFLIFNPDKTHNRKIGMRLFRNGPAFLPNIGSDELINRIINESPSAIVVLNRGLKVRLWNHTAEKLFGWTSDEVLGHPLPIVPVDQEDNNQKIFYEKFQGMEKSKLEMKMFKKDGKNLEVIQYSVPLQDIQGELLGIILFMDDISDYKSALESLRKSEERFSLFMRHFPGIAFMQDTEGRYVYGNEAWFTQLPRKHSHLWQNQSDDDEWPPKKSRNTLEEKRKVLNERKVLQTIETATLGDMDISMLILKFPIMDKDGIPVLLGGVGINITERRKFEEAARDYKEKLSSLAVAMSLAEETERRRIAAELHDRIGQALALSKIKIDSIDKHTIADSGIKTLEEINRLIDMSIQQIRSLTFQISPPLLYEVGLGSAVEWLGERLFDDYGLSVIINHDLSPASISEEIRGTLFAIIRELLINVAKHADATHAEVNIKTVDDSIKIEVKDDGRGFEPVIIFKEERKEGGFGLFNIRQKIAYLDGEFFIDSVVGKGTKVLITAPIR